jgi:CheY-like chemotaxis protein
LAGLEQSGMSYCPSCGQGVDTYEVEKEQEIEVRCSACSYPVGVVKGEALRGLACVLIADDERLFRSLVTDLLVEQGLAQKVIPCESGAEFLTVATERILQGLPIKVAILDIIMEPLDGIATAVALRAFEKALKVTQPIPILFLSALPFDSSLKSVLDQNQPALYLNKGSDAVPEKLGPRLARVIGHLLQRERG